MNSSLIIWTVIIALIGAAVYLVIYSFVFKPNKFLNHEQNQLNFEKFKYAGSFVKWIITGILIYALGIYINDTFKNREVGIEEMKQYDTYVNNVLGKDLETRKAYALYYSIITPNDTLRHRWKVYLDTLNFASAALKSINEKLDDSTLSKKQKIQLLKQRDSIKSNLQLKPSVNIKDDSENTLYRIDVTFYNIEDYATSPLDFKIYDDGSSVFDKYFEPYHFLKSGMNGSRTETMLYTETKNDLKGQALYLEIPISSGFVPKSVSINCDIKFYFYNGKISILKKQVFEILPGMGAFLPLWNKNI